MGAQWLLAVAAWLLGRRPAGELLEVAGLGESGGQLNLGGALWGTVLLLLLIVVANALMAVVATGVVLAVGQRVEYRRALSWVAYGLLPLALGLLTSRVLFAIVQPLADSPEYALALLFRPFSLGPASFMPQLLPPLSLGWFVASYLDLFGVWSLWLLVTGARELIGLTVRQTAWLTLLLMLVSLAILTGCWQGSQQLLIRLAT